ncbi:MAG: hypothetical protein RIR00_644 [Pseudomonadota bacterium]|jgi:UDP-N-acetylmuramyl pentapeptide phosphotransferase/UDP-N-acetylglucosamine-1-phosphate transferase
MLVEKAAGEQFDLVQLLVVAVTPAFLISAAICFLIIKFERFHSRFTHDTHDGPQKFHVVPTARIGGLGLAAGVVLVYGLLQGRYVEESRFFGLLLLASIPAFMGGLVEDMTKRVSVMTRLVLSMVSAVLASVMLGATVLEFDILGLTLHFHPFFAIMLTAFAVSGATNAVNIIDGYNGLASGVGIIVLTALAIVALANQDFAVMFAALAMVGALVGFLVFNWPGGKIFLGDGGAYLLGVWISELCILLVTRNPGVSIWFPLLLMIYPVYETLFSIFRRRYIRKQHPGHPDRSHLHQLVYSRLIRGHLGCKQPSSVIRRNSRVVFYFWPSCAFLAVFGVICVDKPLWLQFGVLVYCLAYTWLYFTLLAHRAPRFMRARVVW